jgi:hypothetical protein
MIVIEDLQHASSDVASLQNYLTGSFEKVYDFFTHQKHSDLVASRDKLNRYIRLNQNILIQLDIDNKTNLAFISLLLDISEQLGLIGSFRFLYDHLNGKDYNIGERLKAASLYLIGVTTADDYLNRYVRIYDHLQLSSETEEDKTDRVLMTMVNYYAQVINDFGEFNIGAINSLKSKVKKSLSNNEFSFLHSKLITDVLAVDLDDFSLAYSKIHLLLDSFLGRDIIRPNYKKEFLLESGTPYCALLAGVANSFREVRQISYTKHQSNPRKDEVYRSLLRGVKVLETEEELFAYLNSYGNMHYEKLIEAFKVLPKAHLDQETNIIDWGCGQAMASMTYFDFLNQKGIKQPIRNLTLIEPSEIALKRASLHVKKFNQTIEINTINKD